MPAIASMNYVVHDAQRYSHAPFGGFRPVGNYQRVERWYPTGFGGWRSLHAFSACGNPLMRTYYRPSQR